MPMLKILFKNCLTPNFLCGLKDKSNKWQPNTNNTFQSADSAEHFQAKF